VIDEHREILETMVKARREIAPVERRRRRLDVVYVVIVVIGIGANIVAATQGTWAAAISCSVAVALAFNSGRLWYSIGARRHAWSQIDELGEMAELELSLHEHDVPPDR
jgi:hypothetical protein